MIELNAENVKRLRAVRIRPDGAAMVVIGGDNAQGKSSVLDALEMALAGGHSIPEDPIRHGEKRAVVEVDLGPLKVKRTITPKGSTVVVCGADGVPMASPQAILDKLYGELSFDPLAFSRMKPGEAADTLRGLMALDFTAVDKERADLFAERTIHNRDVAQLEGALLKTPTVPGEPEERVDVSAIRAQVEAANLQNAACDREGDKAESLKRALQDANAHAEDMRRELERAQERHTAALARVTAANTELEAQCAKVAAMPTVSTVELVERIDAAAQVNARCDARAARAVLEEKLAGKRKEAAECSRLIDEIDAEKLGAVSKAAASFPVPGLGFGSAGVTLNGVPFAQASSAEQLRVSMAVGLALNPKLKVILIRDGSLLDAQSLALVARMAEEGGAQVWVERVGKADACAVIIEDGEVVEG